MLGTFWRLGWRERKKGTKSANKHRMFKHLLHAFSYRFRVYSVRLGARRRKSRTEKLLKIIGFCGGICVCAICARSATILQTERKSNKITVKSHTKSTLPRKLKKHQKSAVLRVKMPPKIDPGGRGEPPDRLPRATSAKKAFILGAGGVVPSIISALKKNGISENFIYQR